MDYSKFDFKNKPSIEEMLARNAFIFGPCGAGKTVFLHQVLNELSKIDNLKDYDVYVHDPKGVAFDKKDFPFVKFFVHDFDQIFIEDIKEGLMMRKLVKNNKITLIVSDEIADSNLGTYLLSIYGESVKNDLHLILASQVEDFYIENKDVLDKENVYFIKGEYGDNFRTIEVK